MALPPKVANLLMQGIAHHEAGRFDRAEPLYRQLAAIAPGVPDVWECLGTLLQQRGKPEEAIRCFGKACQLDPKRVSSAVRLTWALIEAGRAADAEKTMRGVTQRVPDSAPAWNALGYAVKINGRIAEARECHERAVKIDPKYADGWHHLGLTVGLVGSTSDALKYHDKALALNPRLDSARYGRAQALQKLYRASEAVAEYEAFLKKVPGHLDARSYRLFALQALENVSREALFAEHCAYGKVVGAGTDRIEGYDLDPERRLRIAILSPDLRTHSCAYFLEPLLEHLDRAQFEIYLYHDHFVEDSMSERLKRLAAKWRNFVGQPHSALERAIRDDRIDILIDLAAHVSNTVRLPLLARRVAPVQVTYLGYPDTTGVPAIDYRFTDPIADPVPEADAFATEKLVRFAPTAWCYVAPREAGPVAPPPCTVSEQAPVTFGSFNCPTKFTPTMFRAWARILEAVPRSRLTLKGRDFAAPDVRAFMCGRLQDAGVPLDRVDLLSRTATTAEHLALYARMDVALDTHPYGGTTTTCEALWMGRPVVTLVGNRHAARVGASLLTAIGRPQWIARDVDEYVRVAVSLAANRAELREHSMHLREAMQASPLLDHAGQAACFGAALRACWKERTARLV